MRGSLMLLEKAIRPWCCRLPDRLQDIVLLPILPLYVAHQNFYTKGAGEGSAQYGWREALHSARDRFTPRYAHRHTEEEVSEWFRAAGYDQLVDLTRRERPPYMAESLLMATAIEGRRIFVERTASRAESPSLQAV
jgi:hypothetical protein